MKRGLTDEQIDALAATWIEAVRRGEQAADEQVHQSVVALSFLYTADTQWNFILAAVDSAADTIDELYGIAAGPFESLMGTYGDEYIERVEVEAAHCPKFRNMLHGSWQHLMHDDVWARVQAVRGEPLD